MLTRQSGVRKAAIAAGAALSGAIDLREMAGGILKNDGMNWTVADIVFDVCETAGGTFTTLEDETGTAGAFPDWRLMRLRHGNCRMSCLRHIG